MANRRSEAGFTLSELLTNVLTASLVIACAMPVLGLVVSDAKDRQTYRSMVVLSQAAELYLRFDSHHSYPPTVETWQQWLQRQPDPVAREALGLRHAYTGRSIWQTMNGNQRGDLGYRLIHDRVESLEIRGVISGDTLKLSPAGLTPTDGWSR